MTLIEWQSATIEEEEVLVIRVHKHKTGGHGDAAHVSIYDQRLVECLRLYAQYVRPDFVALSNPPGNPENPDLQFFLNREGRWLSKVAEPMRWFKRCVTQNGWETAAGLVGFSSRCFRSCLSQWAMEHEDPRIRANAASLQVYF